MTRRIDSLQEKVRELSEDKENAPGATPESMVRTRGPEPTENLIVKTLEETTKTHMDSLQQIVDAQTMIIKQLRALELSVPRHKGSASSAKNSSIIQEEQQPITKP